MVAQLWRYALDPDYAAMAGDSDLEKCAAAMAKSISKFHTTALKELGACQRASDKIGGGYAYVCGGADPKDKIAAAEQKLRDTFSKRCADLSDVQRRDLGSCDHDLDIPDCVVGAIRASADGLSATRFEYTGVCPTGVDILRNGTEGGGFVTDVSTGHTGLGHFLDLPRGMTQAIDVACTDGSCGQCPVSLSCRDGSCRCANDHSAVCDEPFGADVDDCGGAECRAYFGPPHPINAGGSFACFVTTYTTDIVGDADIGRGAFDIDMRNEVSIYSTGTQSRPCPVCGAGPLPDVGDVGSCVGGNDPGAPCTVDAVVATFGATSFDCQPTDFAAVSVLRVHREFSSEPQQVGFDLPCTTGDAAGCPCAVCAGDPGVGCASGDDCLDAGVAGPCAGHGAGVPTVSNSCAGLICASCGVCATGSISYCDGFTDASGRGIIACSVDGDCTALNSECPGGNCGTCSLEEPRPCFNDPIVADEGRASLHGPVLSSLTCVAADISFVAAGPGLPGVERFTLDLEVVNLCPDGITEWQLGGSSCP